jgi:hypothetical protein
VFDELEGDSQTSVKSSRVRIDSVDGQRPAKGLSHS